MRTSKGFVKKRKPSIGRGKSRTSKAKSVERKVKRKKVVRWKDLKTKKRTVSVKSKANRRTIPPKQKLISDHKLSKKFLNMKNLEKILKRNFKEIDRSNSVLDNSKE